MSERARVTLRADIPAGTGRLPGRIRACLFDMDGVLTETATLHAAAWKQTFDDFLAAARELGVEPAAASVFEDALAGVAAGRAGGFAFVVGVDRAHQAVALRRLGADVVVADLAELLASS